MHALELFDGEEVYALEPVLDMLPDDEDGMEPSVVAEEDGIEASARGGAGRVAMAESVAESGLWRGRAGAEARGRGSTGVWVGMCVCCVCCCCGKLADASVRDARVAVTAKYGL